MADDPLNILSPAAEGGSGLASPIASIAGVGSIVGAGLSIFGTYEQAQAQKQEAGISSQIATTEEAINAQRQQQMVLNARRSQMENFRNTQRARAQGIAAGVNQGAQFGSGMAGGQAQAAAQGATNNLGITQNLQIGQNIFGLTQQQDALQAQLAGMQGTSANYAGISAIGGDISRSAQPLGSLFGSFGAQANAPQQPSWTGQPTGYIQ